jgi:ribosomal protein S18 acetylase RimI-like enzyme
MRIERADYRDLEEILDLQKRCYLSESEIYDDPAIPPLTQTLGEIEEEHKSHRFYKITTDGKIIASVRAREDEGTCFIGKLIVHPDFQNRGMGSRVMEHVESDFPEARRFELFTGYKSLRNLHLYRKLEYVRFKEKSISQKLTLVFLEKIPS